MSKQLIGKYEVISTLGRGTMGVVYKALDPDVGRVVAVKTLRSLHLTDNQMGNEALLRFKQESRSAGRLQHPNIVVIYEAGNADDGAPFIAMEYVEGVGLDSIINQRSPLDPLEALHYLAQTASAIDYAHSQNVLHRDIKPSNIIIDPRYRIKLLDFGVAKLSDASLTPAGIVVGTPSYMAPEQIRGESLDAGCDLFSFAVVTYETLSGERPFPGKDFSTVVSNIMNKEPQPLTKIASFLPSELLPVLSRGLSKERRDRFPSALEFIDAVACVFNTTIDGSGLIGGYQPVLKWRATNKTSVITQNTPENRKSNQIASPENIAIKERPSENQTAPAVKKDAQKPRFNFYYNIVTGVLVIFFVVGMFVLYQYNNMGAYPREDNVSSEKLTQTQEPEEKIVADTPFSIMNPLTEDAKKKAEDEDIKQDILEPIAELTMSDNTHKIITEPSQVKNLSDTVLVELLQNPQISISVLREAIKESGKRHLPAAVLPINQLSGNQDYRVRIEVLRALMLEPFSSDPSSLKTVINLLSDGEYLVRGFAAKALTAFNKDLALPVLKARYPQEENDVVKKSIDRSVSFFESR